MRTLDFNEDASYRNPSNDTCGDINENGVQETIKEELTNPDGKGFLPIGLSTDYKNFYGVFDGQGYEIRNIFIGPRNTCYSALFGDISYAIIKNVGLTGSITGSQYAAGICGEAYNSHIWNCYNKATVSVQSDYGDAAGICRSQIDVYGCYNLGEINAPNAIAMGIGGICKNCFNAGNIKGKYATGLGYYSSTYNSYNIGNIGTEDSTYSSQIGAYYSSYTVENCYGLDTAVVSGTVNEHANTILKDEAYMKSAAFVTDLGSNYWQADTNNINNGYPIPKLAVTTDTFVINSVEDWVEMYLLYKSGLMYKLNLDLRKDIDFESDESYINPLDTSYGDLNGDGVIEGIKAEITNSEANFVFKSFEGIFDVNIEGNNHKISNYPSERGLILRPNDFKAKNFNLHVKENINGSNATAALLADANRTENIIIDNCNVYGTISGSSNAGGFVGSAYAVNEIRITNSNNYCTINARYSRWSNRIYV